MQNKKASAKASELSFFVRHIALLAFALVAGVIFSSMGFINTSQIPITVLLAFISLEWVYFQHKNARPDKLN